MPNYHTEPPQDNTPYPDFTQQGQFQSPPIRETEFFRWLEDSSEDMFNFALYLAGKTVIGENKDGSPILRDVTRPLMNEKGIHYTMTMLHPILNKNTFMSNYDEDRIYKKCLDTSLDFNERIAKGAINKDQTTGESEFGLREEDLKPIASCFRNLIESAFRRPMAEGERNTIRSNKTEHEVTNNVVEQNQSGGGLFGFLRR